MLCDTLGEEMAESLTSVERHRKEAREEVQEGVGTVVVVRSVRIRPVLQDLINPVKGLPQLAAATIGVEKGEYVNTNNRIWCVPAM